VRLRPPHLAWPKPQPVRDLYPGLCPLQRQLLGASASQLGYWIPGEEDVPLRGWMRKHGLIDPARPAHR
jgi:hypothetical protein